MTSLIRSGRDRRRDAPQRPAAVAAPAAGAPPGRGTTVLFGATLLLGAALLFAVQPMFARTVLPVLGGTSAVWATSMVFFQAALLAAYAYAHWSVRRLGSRRQAVLHVVLLVPPLLVLPAGIPDGWLPPTGGQPGLWLLGVLVVGIGPPFVAVAATAPLLQRWYVDSGHPRGTDPYFLYRASNLGSILGLLGYPLLLEPALRLQAQGELWRAGYVLLGLLVAACAVVLWRSEPAAAGAPANPAAAPERAETRQPAEVPERAETREPAEAPEWAEASEPAEPAERADRAEPASPAELVEPAEPADRAEPASLDGGLRRQPTGRDRLRWIALAFIPSCLLIGVTNILTTDLAPIPLLWVLPLTIYLATFIVAFSAGRAAGRAWLWSRRLLPAQAGLALWVVLSDVSDPLTIFIPFHLVTFAIAAMFCHGRLAAERPPADALTGFYLALAAGGALGGLAAGLLAPIVFNDLLEYPLGLVLALLAVPATARAGAAARAHRRWAGRVRALAGPVAIVVLLPPAIAGALVLTRHAHVGRRAELVLVGLAVLAAIVLPRRRPGVRALATCAVFLVAASTVARLNGEIFADRSFYGVLSVRGGEGAAYHTLLHGTTIHGAQSTDPARRTVPLTYFAASGPAGDIVRAARDRGLTDQVAVVGLGAGTLACQAQAGERFTFYEIDPLVQRIATDPALFSYLRDCPGRTDVVLGDARVSLSRQPDARFGLLMLDAFSSDAVPVHLLTREAVELYRARLEPGGLIAFHVTNRYLDLEPVVGRITAALGLACAARWDQDQPVTGPEAGKSTSQWLLVGGSPAELGSVGTNPRWQPCRAGAGRVWTDDYTNVVGAVDW